MSKLSPEEYRNIMGHWPLGYEPDPERERKLSLLEAELDELKAERDRIREQVRTDAAARGRGR
ncbi:MAG: hypothetical protein M3P51_02400 [Chloroflexota bacterium]|nr:hypothetical protein [Chloroflexota bacterium]